jgi:SAM-dependent methyltransferase
VLNELREIIARRAGRLDLSSLRRQFDGEAVRTPADMLDFAQALCRIACEKLPDEAARTAAQMGADLLVRFIAELPDDLARSLRQVPDFAPAAERAWLEPSVDPFVALGCTVQDVWAHLLGPESSEDDAIAAAICWHAPGTVYDLGCGAGHFAHVLAALGVAVDGHEIDPVKRAFFEYRASESGLAQRMRLGRRRDTYDMVLALNVLDHLSDPESALDTLVQAVRRGGNLCTLAAFPADGWHQSDPDIVSSCGRSLWNDFTLTDCPSGNVAWMDCWARRSAPLPELALGSRPRVNPGSTFHREAADRVVLHANRFYSQQLLLDGDTTDICNLFDGGVSVRDVALRCEVDPEELLDLCRHLQGAGHLYASDNHPTSEGRPTLSSAAIDRSTHP